MDFELNEEQEILKNTARDFMQREVIPIAGEYDKNKKFPPRELIKKMIPIGYIGTVVPEEYGGHGGDYLCYFILVEELAKAWPSLRTIITTVEAVINMIFNEGSEEQKRRFLPNLLSARVLSFVGITEPNVGSDAGSIETKAVLDGDYFVINGTKILITNGSMADLGLVFCSTDKRKGPKGISALVVEKEISPYQARDIEKMGMDASVLSEIVFEDCHVPKANMLGRDGEGLKIALSLLGVGRCVVAFSVVGVAEACIEACIKYAKERRQFGKPIGSFQLVQEMIVEMVVETEAARLLAFKAGTMVNQGKRCVKEASIAKLYSSEAALRVAHKAIQIHGGYGYTREFPVERFYRDIRHLTMAEGTSEIQKLIIGREIIGISAFV